MSDKHWKILKSELVFNHKWYKLRKDAVRLPNGRIVDDYFVSVRPNVAVIFALTAEKEVILVKQYKHGIGEVVLELPGGVIDIDEAPEVSARRELLEETGYLAEKYVPLATLADNPTKDTNRIYLYLATDAKLVAAQDLDDNEDIEVIKVPLKDIKKEITEGRITVSGSIAAIFLGLSYLENHQDN